MMNRGKWLSSDSRQQTGCCCLLSEVAADRHFTYQSVSTNIKSSLGKKKKKKNLEKFFSNV